jgi:hypothetical protein
VGPRAGLDTEARGKILCPCRGSNPDRPVVQPVVRHVIHHFTREIRIGFDTKVRPIENHCHTETIDNNVVIEFWFTFR